MGLSDRIPGTGRRGVVVALATGVTALLLAGVLVWSTWGGDDGASPSARETESSAPEVVRVASRPGGFSVAAPASLVGKRIGPNVQLVSGDRKLVVTVGPGPRGPVPQALQAELDGIRRSYQRVQVERTVDATLAGLPARRAVGTVVQGGRQLVFAVTTTGRNGRTWSVAMFAHRDIEPKQLESLYQPVLDGFLLLG